MKKIGIKFSALVLAAALLAPASLLAQKEEKDKETKEKKDVQTITITRKGDKADKVIVEIDGDKITVNGKPLDEYKGKDGDLSVSTHKYKEFDGMSWTTPRSNYSFNYNGDNLKLFGADSNHAMLGVTTEEVDGGVLIQDITKESAAEKAGLKENDIITKVDEKSVKTPDDLSELVRKHKPGDKVSVTYLRDKKEQKTTAELTKWKGYNVFGTQGQPFKMDMGDMNFGNVMPRAFTTPGKLFRTSSGPKLGLSIQDTDDGKGVKVIEVDDESNSAKAGLKEDDVITEVDGKAVNGADEMAKIIRDSKDKVSVMMKVQRAGKTQNIEVKIPRKLKTADL